jgi:hypothetical protein
MSYDPTCLAEGPKFSLGKIILTIVLLIGAIWGIKSWSASSEKKANEPKLLIDRTTVVREIPFVLLPGEQMQVFKVFRDFEDGSRELMEYSILMERDSSNEHSVIQYSSQGENGIMGDDPIIGETRPLYKFDIGSFAGTNKENREIHYIKMRNKSIMSDGERIGPVKGTIYLRGRNRSIQYPDGRIAPLRWE